MTELNILAINIAIRPDSKIKIFPLGLAYVLSSIKRNGFDFELLDIDAHRYSDEKVIEVLSQKTWDICLLGAIVTGYSKVKQICADIKEANPTSLIIVGNSVASSIPEILLSKTDADIAVIGEGDNTIVEILNSWSTTKDLMNIKGIYYKNSNGEIIQNQKRQVVSDIDSIPSPIHDVFDVEKYIEGQKGILGEPLPLAKDQLRPFPLIVSRGCIARCTFCYHCFIGEKFRHRSSKHVINEIKLLKSKYGINYIHLCDDLSFFSKKQVGEFVGLLEKEELEIYWHGSIRGNLFQDHEDIEILKKMKDFGCVRLNFSLESADEEILKSMKKSISIEQFRRQKALLDKAGIEVKTSVVLGYPQETSESISKTFQFCLDVGIYPSTGFLLPQPMTPVYEWCKHNKLICDEEEYLMHMGDRQDFHINLTKMENNEFLDTVQYWLKILNNKLNVGLEEDRLFKTQHHRSKKSTQK